MDLRRFVTYIYQYEQGKRGKNAGFIKADMREGGCRIEIQVRGQERIPGRGRVYLIVSDADALPVGDMAFGQGGGRVKLFFNRNQLQDSGYTADQIKAVVIRCDGGRLFVSCWAEHVPESILHGQFHVLGEPEKEPRKLPEEPRPEEAKPEEEPKEVKPEEAFVPREEISDMDGGLRVEGPAAVDGGLQAEAVHTEAPPQLTDYRKIEITDIRGLPKSNWHLCSNSFLIHGFFNYHYLMLKTVERDGQKNCWIGVPGIYEQPERMMALMFGFPEFEPARQEQTDTAAGSGRSGSGVFGYWMCRLTC